MSVIPKEPSMLQRQEYDESSWLMVAGGGISMGAVNITAVYTNVAY